jgi:hypothetical protein
VRIYLHIERVVIDESVAIAQADLEAALSAALADRLDHSPPVAAHDARRRADVVPRGRAPVADLVARAVAGAVMPGGVR